MATIGLDSASADCGPISPNARYIVGGCGSGRSKSRDGAASSNRSWVCTRGTATLPTDLPEADQKNMGRPVVDQGNLQRPFRHDDPVESSQGDTPLHAGGVLDSDLIVGGTIA